MATASTSVGPYSVAAGIDDKLRRIRARTIALGLSGVAVLGLAVLIAGMLLAMLIDWLTLPGNDVWRPWLTVAPLAATAAVVIAGAWRVFQCESPLCRAAAAVDAAIPELEERWSTLAEIWSRTVGYRAHPAMFRQLAKEAAAWAPRIEPAHIVSSRALVKPLMVLLVAVVAICVTLGFDHQRALVLMQRFWSPGSDMTLTRIEGLPAELVVAEGETATLEARLAGRVPAQAELQLCNDRGDESRLHLKVDATAQGLVSHRVPGAETPFSFRWSAGDARSAWVPVVVAKRPRIADVRFEITPPGYTKRPVVRHEEWPSRVQVVEGSILEIALRSTEPLRQVRLEFGKDKNLFLEADGLGWYRWRTEVTEAFAVSPILVETHGLMNLQPPVCRVQLYRDQPPTVKVVSPTAEMAVQPNDEIDIHFVAGDDFAVNGAELVIYGDAAQGHTERQELKTIPIDLGNMLGVKQVTGAVQLKLADFDLRDGQSISYVVRVYDNRVAPVGTKGLGPSAPTNLVGGGAQATPATSPAAPASSQSAERKPDATAVTDNSAGATSSPLAADAQGRSTSTPSPAHDQRASKATTPVKDLASDSGNRSASDPTPNPSDKSMGSKGAQNEPASTTSDEGRKFAGNHNIANDRRAQSASTNDGNAGASSPDHGDIAAPKGMVSLNKNDAENQRGQSLANGGLQNVPGDSMTRRMLDLPQSASSSPMLLKIDQWVGSFDGQQREKIALAISPVLSDLDEYLAEAAKLTDAVAGRLEHRDAWTADLQQQIGRADNLLQKCEGLVANLQKTTTDTPYAFIGLQLNLVVQTHIDPARDSLWESQQLDSKQAELVRSAWQEISSARMQLAELIKSFERTHREHRLAEALQKVKKMYQVFVDDSLALLQPQKGRVNDYERRIAELELDDEYLKRLKEVLEMRRDLQAELARLLTDDPRLMRRFMDRLMTRGETLRDQLTILAERQKESAREVRAWLQADAKDRSGLLATIIQMRQTRWGEISLLAVDQNERFVTWMPLDLVAENPAFREVRDASKSIAATAQMLASWPAEKNGRLDAARECYTKLGELDRAIRRVDLGGKHDGLANHLLNRLAEVRNLTLITSAWIRQADLLDKGQYWEAAAIEQYVLAMDTDVLAGKLADIDLQVSAALPPNADNSSAIADKTRALLSTLDKELSANQLAATFALRRQQGAAAVEKEAAAVAAFDKAEKLFDELMRAVIDELDKLPIRDPIAALLEDPTLDELLAELENEGRFYEVLGIPCRPTNLAIIQDWMQSGSGGAASSAGRMITAQMRRDADRAGQNANDAYRQALARALKEQESVKAKRPRTLAPHVQWNKLLSTLNDELLQGKGELLPQEYRRAIEQYFARISRIENPQEPRKSTD